MEQKINKFDSLHGQDRTLETAYAAIEDAVLTPSKEVVFNSMESSVPTFVSLKSVLEHAKQHGVIVVFSLEKVRFNPDDDCCAQQAFEAVYNFYRSFNRNRQSKGIEKAKKNGKYKGRPLSITPDMYPELIQMKQVQKWSYTKIGKTIGRDRVTVSKAFDRIYELQRQGKDPRVKDMFDEKSS